MSGGGGLHPTGFAHIRTSKLTILKRDQPVCCDASPSFAREVQRVRGRSCSKCCPECFCTAPQENERLSSRDKLTARFESFACCEWAQLICSQASPAQKEWRRFGTFGPNGGVVIFPASTRRRPVSREPLPDEEHHLVNDSVATWALQEESASIAGFHSLPSAKKRGGRRRAWHRSGRYHNRFPPPFSVLRVQLDTRPSSDQLSSSRCVVAATGSSRSLHRSYSARWHSSRRSPHNGARSLTRLNKHARYEKRRMWLCVMCKRV